MNKKFAILGILLLAIVGFGSLLLVPQINAVAIDNYRVRVGDWYIHSVISTKGDDSVSVGDETKTYITAVNSSTLISPLVYADMVWILVTNRSTANTTWTSKFPEGYFAVYNCTDPNLMSLTGNSGYSFNGAFGSGYLSIGCLLGCNNLTALHLFLNLTSPSLYNTNQTSRNDLTFIYWNGTTDGNGVIPGASKLVISFESTKYVCSNYKIYNWTGTTWDLTFEMALTSYSWYVAPATIPGFEIVMVGIALIGLLGLYLWKKNKIKIY